MDCGLLPLSHLCRVPPRSLTRLRRLCLALPEAREKLSHGAPTFFVEKGKVFAMFASGATHHGAGRDAVWLNAAPGNQALMIAAAPGQYFRPPYVGPNGWVGVYLDGGVTDWDELADLLRDSWRLAAPKKLLATLGRDG